MLDPWIIEEIRRREDEERAQKEERPALHVPVSELPWYRDEERPPKSERNEREDRGVAIIDFTI